MQEGPCVRQSRLPQQRNSGGEPLANLGRPVFRDATFRFDLLDFLLNLSLFTSQVFQPGLQLVGRTNDKIRQRVDHELQPRIRADEPQILFQRPVQKHKDVFNVGRQLVDGFVSSGHHQSLQPLLFW